MKTETNPDITTPLPCPFCGSEAEFGVVPDSSPDNFGGEFIECTNAQCGASTCLMFPAMEAVKPLLLEKWNARADSPRLAALNGELLAAVQHLFVCDFPDEIDFRCEGCEAARAALAKAGGAQ